MMGRGEIVYSSLSRQSEGGIDLPPPRIRTAAFKGFDFDGLRNHRRQEGSRDTRHIIARDHFTDGRYGSITSHLPLLSSDWDGRRRFG